MVKQFLLSQESVNTLLRDRGDVKIGSDLDLERFQAQLKREMGDNRYMKNKTLWIGSVSLIVFSMLVVSFAQAADEEVATSWNSWRAVSGNTAIPKGDYPVTWSSDKNVAWKVDLPDKGNSTPIINGKRIFVTQSLAKTKSRGIVCYDTETGKKLWEKYVVQKKDEKTHPSNPYCSPSPTVDGNTVITWLGNSGVFAFSLDGKELWKKDLGPVDHVFGYGSSPVVYDGICYLNHGPGKYIFLVALEVKTGKEVWRTPVTVNERPYGGMIEGSYTTPIFVKNSKGETELVTTFPGFVVSLNPKTGKEIWRCGGLDHNVHGSPAAYNGVVVAFGGYQRQSIAVRLGGTGDVTNTHRLWQLNKLNAISAPVFKGDYIYRIANNFATCHETKTGKEMWKERMMAKACWSSPALVGDDLIYVVDKSGTSYVYKANPEKFELVSKNETENVMTNGSLAFASNAIYMRTHTTLWKFKKQ